jgi:hypothetical protein
VTEVKIGLSACEPTVTGGIESEGKGL